MRVQAGDRGRDATGGGGGDVNLDAPYSTGIHRHAAFGGGGWGGGGRDAIKAEDAGWYFRVYVHVRLLRRGSSTREWGGGGMVIPLGWG